MGIARVLRLAFLQRRLLVELARRDIRGRFAGSRFGLLWSVLNPLVQLASYGLIFGFVYQPPGEVERGAFVAMLFCGLWPWWAFQEGTMRGLTALVDDAPLLKKAPLPPEICVLSAVLASAALQTMGFLLFLGVATAAGVTLPAATWWALPGAVGLGLLLASGVSLVLAPLYLVVRDAIHVVTAVLTLLFFASPVLYRLESLPEALQGPAEGNPIAGLIGLYRFAVLGLPVSATSLGVCIAAALLGWELGAWLLGRLDGFLDEYW